MVDVGQRSTIDTGVAQVKNERYNSYLFLVLFVLSFLFYFKIKHTELCSELYCDVRTYSLRAQIHSVATDLRGRNASPLAAQDSAESDRLQERLHQEKDFWSFLLGKTKFEKFANGLVLCLVIAMPIAYMNEYQKNSVTRGSK
jgi:hypothetical protein